MKGHERRFWEQTVAAVSPGWEVCLLEQNLSRPGVSDLDAFFYVVDLSTAWQLLAGMRSTEVLRAASAAGKATAEGLDVQSAADQLVVQASDQSLQAAHDMSREVGNALVLATTQTQTYRIVTSRFGTPAGHWLMLVYRPHAGAEVISRVAFIGKPTPGVPLSVARVHKAAADVCRLDLVQQPGRVAAAVNAMGGAKLAPQFRAR
jgi:hypothetical protein